MSLLQILFFITTLFSDNSQWQRITTDHISFLFPNHPQKLEKMINNIPSTIYQTKDLTCVLGIVCSDMSASKINFTPENTLLFYEEFKQGSLSLETAILKDEKTIPYDNMIIKEIQYSIIKDNHEMTYFKIFIFREDYIYQISIGGRTRHLDIIKAERETFFNSISFPATGENKN